MPRVESTDPRTNLIELRKTRTYRFSKPTFVTVMHNDASTTAIAETASGSRARAGNRADTVNAGNVNAENNGGAPATTDVEVDILVRIARTADELEPIATICADFQAITLPMASGTTLLLRLNASIPDKARAVRVLFTQMGS